MALVPGRVTVVVTHDPRVFAFGDRIITLEDGRVAGEKRQEHKAGDATPLAITAG
jgi:ABC-type lipoprotein export system ATPase subunit